MSAIHQYKLTTGNIETDIVVSTGRTKVATIHVSNENLTQSVFVGVEDKDGTLLFKIAVPAGDSHTITFPEETDFSNGLTICSAATNGDLVRVAISHTRDL